jgi:hypothetical protein
LLKKSNEKRSKLFTKTSAYSAIKDKKALTAMINLIAKHKNRNLIPKDIDCTPRPIVLERVRSVLGEPNTAPPEKLVLLQSNENCAATSSLNAALDSLGLAYIGTYSFPDIKAVFSAIVLRLQQFCNTNSRAPTPVRLALVGNDAFINYVLRTYVDCLGNRPPDWQQYIKFYLVPLQQPAVTVISGTSCQNSTACQLASYLAAVDSQYASNFCTLNKESDASELAARIIHYLNTAGVLLQLPIAEAMLMYKRKNSENCLQAFVPFVGHVQIGSGDQSSQLWNSSGTNRVPIGDEEPVQPGQGSSPPGGRDIVSRSELIRDFSSKELVREVPHDANDSNPLQSGTNCGDKDPLTPLTSTQLTPPNSPGQTIGSSSLFTFSPACNVQSPPSASSGTASPSASSETQDLQIDYWSNVRLPTADSMRKLDAGKCTLKNTFRHLQISRLPGSGSEFYHTPTLTLSYLTKEKRQKS